MNCRHIICRWRWWKWYLFDNTASPVFIGGMYIRGSAVDPIRIERWLAKEPFCRKDSRVSAHPVADYMRAKRRDEC